MHRMACHHDVRRFLWLLTLAAGALASLVLYTLATQVTPIALGGRYLIGWYLPPLAVLGSVLSVGPSRTAAGAAGSGRAAAFLALAGAIHVYCMCFILSRYF
jgi:hypothetical protein